MSRLSAKAAAQRRHRIAELIREYPITSQDQIRELLAAEDIAATQATISRDLEHIGALKVRSPDEPTRAVYFLPEVSERRPLDESHLRRIMLDWVVSVQLSTGGIVLRTVHGAGAVVASYVDRSRCPGVVGSIAGVDTVLVLVEAGHDVSEVLDRLESMLVRDVAEPPLMDDAPPGVGESPFKAWDLVRCPAGGCTVELVAKDLRDHMAEVHPELTLEKSR